MAQPPEESPWLNDSEADLAEGTGLQWGDLDDLGTWQSPTAIWNDVDERSDSSTLPPQAYAPLYAYVPRVDYQSYNVQVRTEGRQSLV